MTAPEGPMNFRLHRSTIVANRSFSAKKPYPGWMALHPEATAALMILFMLR